MPINWPDLGDSYFRACFVCLDYDHKFIEKIIKRYKYDYIEKLADPLSSLLCQQAQQLNLPPDTMITNVPLHHYKKRQRGFDQTELLAKKLAQKLNLPYQALLQRIKKTKSQAQMNKADRQENVSGAFTILDRPSNYYTTSNSILLIDDIATTGATLNEAAKILNQAGYKNINCLVLAKNNP